MGIADEYDGEHVDVLRVELGKGGDLDFLVVATRLTDVAHRGLRRAHLQEEFHEAVELPVAPVRLGIVDGCDEIAAGCRLDAALDEFPGRHQVGERDDAQVVTDGCP